MGDIVFRFPAPGPEPITADLDGWKKVEGNPTMKTWIQHTSNDGSVISGTWEATPGTYHATYGAYEFVHLIDGQITITPDGGSSVTVNPSRALHHTRSAATSATAAIGALHNCAARCTRSSNAGSGGVSRM